MGKRARVDRTPTATDWLYACPSGLPTSAIAASLGVVGQPVTEVSARTWQHDWDMANTFMEAYGYPKNYWFSPGEPVHWDGFEDWMLIKKTVSEHDARGRLTQFRFVGETIIVREGMKATEGTLAFLLDVVSFHIRNLLKRYDYTHVNPSHARVVVVLDGWEKPLVAGRVTGQHRVAFQVNQMASAQQAEG
jgi:hypothetical protein